MRALGIYPYGFSMSSFGPMILEICDPKGSDWEAALQKTRAIIPFRDVEWIDHQTVLRNRTPSQLIVGSSEVPSPAPRSTNRRNSEGRNRNPIPDGTAIASHGGPSSPVQECLRGPFLLSSVTHHISWVSRSTRAGTLEVGAPRLLLQRTASAALLPR